MHTQAAAQARRPTWGYTRITVDSPPCRGGGRAESGTLQARCLVGMAAHVEAGHKAATAAVGAARLTASVRTSAADSRATLTVMQGLLPPQHPAPSGVVSDSRPEQAQRSNPTSPAPKSNIISVVSNSAP